MRSIIVLTILFALLASHAAGQAGNPPLDLQQEKAKLEATKETLKTQAFGAQGLTKTETEQTINGKKVKVQTYTDPATGAVMTITLDEQGNVLSAQMMTQDGQVTPLNVKVEDGQIKLSMTNADTGSFLQVTVKSDGSIQTELATSTGEVLKVELSSQGQVVSDTVIDTKTKTTLTTTVNSDGSKTETVADLAAGKAQTTEVDAAGNETVLPIVDIPAIPEGATWCSNTGQWEV
jgi:hypothetical protein